MKASSNAHHHIGLKAVLLPAYMALSCVHVTAGYIGLGAYFDGKNSAQLRLRQSQPVIMRFLAEVRARTLLYPCLADVVHRSAVCSLFSYPVSGLSAIMLQSGDMHQINRPDGQVCRAEF